MPWPRIVLLDTSHLSDMAREPQRPDAAAMIRRLQAGDAALAISLFHLLEFADPGFRSVDELRALLRDVPHVLANPYEDVEDEEIAVACARAAGKHRRPPRVWARDTSEWGSHGGPIGGTAVDMLDAFRASPETVEQVRAMATYGAAGSMMKGAAALVREPLLPLRLAIQHHLDEHRQRLSDYADGLTADEVLVRGGGKAAFPGYQTQESLVEQRMRDPDQKSTANDVYDEFIAFYSPYAAASTVDRRTLHRAKMAQLPAVPRMTRDLAAVPAILDRVAAGDLAVVPSAE